MSKRVIYADVELAGVVQSAIDRQELGELFEVQAHSHVPVGAVVVDNHAHPWHLVKDCYAGLRVLLGPAA